MTTSSPIDRGRLLRNAGGIPGLAADIARIFVERKDEIAPPMRAAIAAGDVQALARAAHTARGALGMVGATVAVALCDDIEARAAFPAMCAPLVEQLADEIERAAAFLRDAG
jgi:HPt (histidine-containing phosphotransfer) domain-containing protein